MLQFCIQFLYPFSSTSNKFNRKNFCVFFLCRKNQFLSQTKNLCLSLRKSSVQRPIFQNLRETKKQKRNKYLKKNSWKMILCLHEYIGWTKGAINAFQLYMYMIYSKFYLNLEVDWVVGIILQVPPTTDCRINKNSIIYM